MIHYNYDCDFKIAEQLIAEAPFRYTYYAKNEKTVVAEYDGTDYHGCYPMGDMLIVPINAGSLGLGEVKVRREYYLTDKDFTDGICNRVTGNVPLGIEIWRGETDGMETHEVKVVPAYQKGDPFTFDDMTDAQKQDIANRVPTKEPEREQAEAKREQNELLRQAKEAERETKEAERQSIFSTNEAERQRIFETNEAIREENETKRVGAEILRQEAETIREATYKNKVDRDDNAPKLTAGFANNLVGRGEATSEEIGFRPSGGDTSIEDGTARIERVKGSTVVWNQLSKVGNNMSTYLGLTFLDNGDDTITVNGTSTGGGLLPNKFSDIYTYVNHVYLILPLCSKSLGFNYIYTSIGGNFAVPAYRFVTETTAGKKVVTLRTESGKVWDNAVVRILTFDLTQMFGAGNEPTTIEEFHARKPIGIDEYAYNEGELISTNVEELKSVGFNAWEGTTEFSSKQLGLNYANRLSESDFHSLKNIYRLLMEGHDLYYSVITSGTPQSQLIGSLSSVYNGGNRGMLRPGIIKASAFSKENLREALEAKYACVYGTTLSDWSISKICIHLAHTGYRNGEYEPYKEFRRSIPIKDIKDKDGNQLFPNGLLSAGKVYDEITATKAIKRIGVVDMGKLGWYTNSQGPRFIAILPKMKSIENWNKIGFINATKYKIGNVGGPGLEGNIGVWGSMVYVQDNTFTDINAFKTSLLGIPFYYELAEPIEVDLEEPLNLDYEVSDFGTEEVLSSGPTTPMKADIIYQFNAVDRIRDNSRHTAEADKKLLDYESRIAALEAMIANLTREGDEVLE